MKMKEIVAAVLAAAGIAVLAIEVSKSQYQTNSILTVWDVQNAMDESYPIHVEEIPETTTEATDAVVVDLVDTQEEAITLEATPPCRICTEEGETTMMMWVSKEDTGTESNTEAQKGLASDSFKRACFNWGIGRELYTAPDTYIWGDGVKIKDNKCYDKFRATELTVENGTITHVVVVNSSMNEKEVFRWDKTNVAGADLRSRILAHFNKMSEGNRAKTLEHYGITDIVNITTEQAAQYAKDFKL